MTICEARKLLGPKHTRTSDEKIQKIIDCYSGLIEVGFQLFEKDKQNSTHASQYIISHNKK